jgi:hypothetical protein
MVGEPIDWKSLISYCKALLRVPALCVVPDPRMLDFSEGRVLSRVSRYAVFKAQKKPNTIQNLEVGVRRVYHRPWGRQRDSIALARGKATARAVRTNHRTKGKHQA